MVGSSAWAVVPWPTPSPPGYTFYDALHSRCKPTFSVAGRDNGAEDLEMECAEDQQWVGGLACGHVGGLTSRGWAVSSWEQQCRVS